MRAMLLSVCLLASSACFAAPEKKPEFDSRPQRQRVAKMMEEGRVAELANEAFAGMIDRAASELEARGENEMATQLVDEWNDFGQDLLDMKALQDVGDHDPFSEWVAVWYAKIEAKLGVQVMEWTHLRDIWVLNYTLKVVFHPEADSPWCSQWTDKQPDDTCQAEYRRHFAGTKWQKSPDPNADKILHHGFAGVVTYWAVDIACLAGTSGAGSLFCGTAGSAAELVIERWFAPGISDRIFLRVNASLLLDGAGCGCDCCDDCDCDDCDCDCCDHDDAADVAPAATSENEAI